MYQFHGEQSVGEIVALMPKAAEVFKHHRIDFCCGGNRPLKDVLAEKHLDEDEILEKLDEAYAKSKREKGQARDFADMSPVQLSEYVTDIHHTYLKRVLPELDELLTTILRVHGMKHRVLFRVHKLFAALKADLEQHLLKEEEILFPLIGKYQTEPSADIHAEIRDVAGETEEEHVAAGNILKELREITEDYEVPTDGCNTYKVTFEMLEELEADLFQHIHLENNILFKKLGI
jgi:regulator of cell morphogenesis and NO signaling